MAERLDLALSKGVWARAGGRDGKIVGQHKMERLRETGILK